VSFASWARSGGYGVSNTTPGSAKSSLNGPQELSNVWQEIGRIQQRVESVEEKEERPWYSTASFIIAASSLLISLISSAFTIVQQREEDISQRRTELIGYVQELARLSADKNPHESEITAIASQASEIALRLSGLSATVYRVIAESLVTDTTYYDRADRIADRAIAQAEASGDTYEAIAGHRIKANIRGNNQDPEGMRREYQAALRLSAEYSGPNLIVKNAGSAYTALHWGNWEVRFKNCTGAAERLQQAQYYGNLAGWSTDDQDIANLKKKVVACQS
jgi:hypothetical protein